VSETSPDDFDRTKAYRAALSFLQSPQGQKIDAWYTQYSEMALGVFAAMQQTGRTDIPLYTWGDDKSTTAAIQRGEVLAVSRLWWDARLNGSPMRFKTVKTFNSRSRPGNAR
jgi:ABC-type sugar transport system substrate-binding protein